VASAGDGTRRVRLIVQNTGSLPSYVTKIAVQHKLLRGVLAEIELPSGAELVSGKPRESLGELEGWAYRHTGVSFWPDRKPTDNLAYVDWVVRAQPGTTIGLTAWHERAGRVRTEATLR
ncbi:MAG: carboxypeptidase, partial [Burkholderiaceae bacterium]